MKSLTVLFVTVVVILVVLSGFYIFWDESRGYRKDLKNSPRARFFYWTSFIAMMIFLGISVAFYITSIVSRL